MGKKKKTVHHTTAVENPYDDAWIRTMADKFRTDMTQQQSWMDSRQSQLGREADLREANRAAIGGLTTQSALNEQQLKNLGSGISGLGGQLSGLQGDFTGLSMNQQQQVKDLYNLAAQDQGVTGVATNYGATFTQPYGSGVGSLNRNELTSQSLNV